MIVRKKFEEVYAMVITRWPEVIDLSDAGPIGPDATGHYFPSLSHALQDAEDAFPDDDSIESLLIWSMFRVLHRHAMRSAKSGITTLKPKEMPKNEIEEALWRDLQTEGWTDLIPTYVRPEKGK